MPWRLSDTLAMNGELPEERVQGPTNPTQGDLFPASSKLSFGIPVGKLWLMFCLIAADAGRYDFTGSELLRARTELKHPAHHLSVSFRNRSLRANHSQSLSDWMSNWGAEWIKNPGLLTTGPDVEDQKLQVKLQIRRKYCCCTQGETRTSGHTRNC